LRFATTITSILPKGLFSWEHQIWNDEKVLSKGKKYLANNYLPYKNCEMTPRK